MEKDKIKKIKEEYYLNSNTFFDRVNNLYKSMIRFNDNEDDDIVNNAKIIKDMLVHHLGYYGHYKECSEYIDTYAKNRDGMIENIKARTDIIINQNYIDTYAENKDGIRKKIKAITDIIIDKLNIVDNAYECEENYYTRLIAIRDYLKDNVITIDTSSDYYDGLELLEIDGNIHEILLTDDYDKNNLFYCEECGNWEYEDNIVTIYDMRGRAYTHVCQDCADHIYYRCCECGKYFTNEAIYNDDYGDFYCEDCMNEGYGDFGCEDEEINDYHNSNYFKTLKNDDEKNDTITYGFELETEPTKCDRLDFTNNGYTYDTDDFIAHRDNDGSLEDGVEFVSHAMTYEYIKSHEDQIKRFLNGLHEIGYTSHDNGRCGLHFHIGRFNGTSLSDITNAKIVYFIHKNWEWFKIFSRRERFAYCDDISMAYNSKKTTKNIMTLIKNKTFRNSSHSYFYIDYDNRTKTSELRLIRGTLNPDTFFASFYITNAIVNVALSHKKVTFSKIKEYLIKKGDYDVVKAYLDKKGLEFNEIKVNKGGNEQCA